ncbi:ElyC/SanA/YdcF family protein [Gulosibacter chungangensis]|nr:ElyC/SanA/YdcF family protein [Gulosibacter chungangensis]
MGGFTASAILAAFFGFLLLPLAIIPYVAWSNRRGTTGFGHALISAAGLVYLVVLWAYTILPLPDPATLQCSAEAYGQFVPFDFIREVNWSNALADSMLRQVLLNVLFFVPLGALVRHLFGTRILTTVLIGAAISLAIEVTQLTGIYGIYPCPYRVFDVDDLLANTLGAFVGAFLAPILAKFPGQHRRDPHAPAKVTAARRLTGALVDFISVVLIGFGLPLALEVTLALAYPNSFAELPIHTHMSWIYAGTIAATAIVMFLIVPATTNATIGQHLSYLRSVRPDGSAPGFGRTLIRFITGGGLYFILIALSTLEIPFTGGLAHLWFVASVLVILIFSPRGISGFASGLVVVDARDPDSAHAARRRIDEPRRMSAAVLALGGTIYLGFSLVLGISTLLPAAGLGLSLLGLVALIASTLFLAGYLLFSGVTVLRREGRSLANMLGLLALAGVTAVLAVFVIAVLNQIYWLLVLSVAALGLTAYLGFIFFAFLLYGQIYARREPRPGMAAVVVLGSRVFGDRVPPLLAARIDRGMAAHRAEVEAGRDPLLILSGGQGADEQVAEGEAMAKYALDAGAEPALVRAETASTTTEENLKFSRELLRAEARGERMLVATNDYHAFRAALLARKLGIDAQVVGAKTARYYFPSAVLREFAAVLFLEKWQHLAFGLGVTLLSGAVAWIIVIG